MTIKLFYRFLLRVIDAVPAIFLILVCIFFVSAQSAIEPGEHFKLNGVRLASPDQNGWHISKSDKLEIIFDFSGDGKTSRAFAKVGPSNALTGSGKFFEEFEVLKTSELENLENLKRDSLHFNKTSFNEVVCMQYDSSLKNLAAAPRTFEYYNVYGYSCPHPLAKDRFVQLEFSNRSNTKGFSEADIKLFKRYFDSIRFTKVQD